MPKHVTNLEIREYMQKNFGFKAKNAWIAHAKEVYGLPIKKAHNRANGERRWPCPKKRLKEFKQAFEYFKML